MREDVVWVDVFTEEYPRVIKANFTDMLPGKNYSIKSLKRDLPDGIQLAPFYEKRLGEPLFKVQKTLRSHIYWQHLKHRFDISKFADLDLAMAGFFPEDTKKDLSETTVQKVLLSKDEEEKIKKLAVLLGKDFEAVKKEILDSRLLKSKQEAAKPKKVDKKK